MFKDIYGTTLSEEEIVDELDKMVKDKTLSTKSSYPKGFSPTKRSMSFKNRHLTYLREHPKLNAGGYLANLKTMLKIRY